MACDPLSHYVVEGEGSRLVSGSIGVTSLRWLFRDGLKKAEFALPEIAGAGSERVAVASDSVRNTAFF